MPPRSILLQLEPDGEPRKAALDRGHLLHQLCRRPVHPIIDDSRALIGKLRTADVVEQCSLALLDALGDLAANRLEGRRRIGNQCGAELLQKRHRVASARQQVAQPIGRVCFLARQQRLVIACQATERVLADLQVEPVEGRRGIDSQRPDGVDPLEQRPHFAARAASLSA
jgi:hypothetical protein